MAYNRSIPQPTDLISNSQPQLLGNFQTIDSGTTGTGVGFARNHVTMTDATNGGLHNRVDYFVAVASPTISGFASSAYPFSITDTGSSAHIELFYKNAAKDSRITDSNLTSSSGEGFMPGGLQVRCGSTPISTGGNSVSYGVQFPTATLAVVATNKNSTAGLANVTSTSATGFTIDSISSSGNVFYVAIGY